MAHLSYHFGDFVCDPAKRELRLRDDAVPLPLKVFECIVYLIEHRDRAVGRDEMLAAVWERVDLADNVLAQTILLARRALGDTGSEQQFIATVRGFGYRWTMPVQVHAVEEPTPRSPPVPAPEPADDASYRRPQRRGLGLLAAVLTLLLLAGSGYRLAMAPSSSPQARPPGAFGHAVVLPVRLDETPRTAWIRLGIMDLIAGQLRTIGLPVMPSDTMLALTEGSRRDRRPGGEIDLEALVRATGAALVLEARAVQDGDHWQVELWTRHGQEPEVGVQGRALDVLDAADLAVGRMALALGFVKPPEGLQERPLATLLQQIESARLSNQMDEARRLLEAAPPDIAAHPEVRFEAAYIDYQTSALDAAESGFRRLLDETSVEPRSASLRGRLLHALSAVAFRRGELEEAERLVSDAIPLLRSLDATSQLGRALSGRASLRGMRGDDRAAREDFELARLTLESAADRLGLARLKNNQGVWALQRERYGDAAAMLSQAADSFRSLHDVDSELRSRAGVLHARLMLLQYAEATAEQPRLRDLVEQSSETELRLHARLLLTDLMLTVGEIAAAERELAAVADEAGDGAWYARSPRLPREGQAQVAGPVLDAVQRRCAANAACTLPPMFWRIAIETRVANGAAAVPADDRQDGSTGKLDAPGHAIAVLLVAGERAARSGDAIAARDAFERALALAETSAVALYLREAAVRYGDHLLASGQAERAHAVAQRLRPWTEWDYESLLLLLRAQNAVERPGPRPADATRLRILAGERPVPAMSLAPDQEKKPFASVH